VIIASGGQPTEQSQSLPNQPTHITSLRPLDLNILATTGICSVGNPPEAIIIRVGWYWLPMLIISKFPMIRATSECSGDEMRREELLGHLEVIGIRLVDLGKSLGGSYNSWIENQVRLRA